MHPLDGAVAKVNRAQEQINALDLRAKRFFKVNTYRIVPAEIDPNTGQQSLRIRTEASDYPTIWSVLIGEVAHDLRCALDHLVCETAILSDPSRGYSFCEERQAIFPIFLYGPRSNRTSGKWTNTNLDFLKRRFRTKIHWLQPYKRRNGGRHSPLWLLHEINNAYRQRGIQLVAVRSSGIAVDFRPSMSGRTVFHGGGIKTGMRLIDGTKVGHSDVVSEEDVQMQQFVQPQIAFWDGCDAVKRLPVVRTLSRISDQVASILNLFYSEFLAKHRRYIYEALSDESHPCSNHKHYQNRSNNRRPSDQLSIPRTIKEAVVFKKLGIRKPGID